MCWSLGSDVTRDVEMMIPIRRRLEYCYGAPVAFEKVIIVYFESFINQLVNSIQFKFSCKK